VAKPAIVLTSTPAPKFPFLPRQGVTRVLRLESAAVQVVSIHFLGKPCPKKIPTPLFESYETTALRGCLPAGKCLKLTKTSGPLSTKYSSPPCRKSRYNPPILGASSMHHNSPDLSFLTKLPQSVIASIKNAPSIGLIRKSVNTMSSFISYPRAASTALDGSIAETPNCSALIERKSASWGADTLLWVYALS